MTRIRDVADRAGVSTATVSRVLNGIPVREDLAEAVRSAVAELGYVPHATARSLRRGQSDVIALVVPDVENPFFTTIARAVEDVAQEAGYSVVLCNSDDDVKKETKYLEIAARENMAGVIIAPATADPAISTLLASRRGVVVIDREVNFDIDQITFDNVQLGRQATRKLLDKGHEQIVCVTGPRTTSTAVQRANGWQQELISAGYPPDESSLTYANFRVDGGKDAAARYLETGLLGGRATAILATNNLVGVGVLQALSTLKSSSRSHVDVGIIGDLPFATSDLSSVSVTSLSPGEMGKAAIQRLLAQIDARLNDALVKSNH